MERGKQRQYTNSRSRNKTVQHDRDYVLATSFKWFTRCYIDICMSENAQKMTTEQKGGF